MNVSASLLKHTVQAAQLLAIMRLMASHTTQTHPLHFVHMSTWIIPYKRTLSGLLFSWESVHLLLCSLQCYILDTKAFRTFWCVFRASKGPKRPQYWTVHRAYALYARWSVRPCTTCWLLCKQLRGLLINIFCSVYNLCNFICFHH